MATDPVIASPSHAEDVVGRLADQVMLLSVVYGACRVAVKGRYYGRDRHHYEIELSEMVIDRIRAAVEWRVDEADE